MSQAFCTTTIEFIRKSDIAEKMLNLHNSNTLFLASKTSVSRFDLTDVLELMKSKNNMIWYSDCSPYPTQKDILRGLTTLKNFSPKNIIAFGGGSVIDFAKALAVFLPLADGKSMCVEQITNVITHKAYSNNYNIPDIVAIPTTAGTGSELTKWATIWDCASNAKYSIECEALKPKHAIMCPDLTITMPRKLTLTTGLDSVAHALEAYWSRRTTPIVQELAKQSIMLSVKYLKLALDDLDNLIFRNYLLRASTLSALAFSQTRTTACHSISYPLTSMFGIDHGLAAALTLGEIFELNRFMLDNPMEIDEFFENFGGIQGWLDYVCQGIVALRLGFFGVKQHDIEAIVAGSFTAERMKNNPYDLSKNDVENLLRRLM